MADSPGMGTQPPSGTVTFLFSDIEGSTTLAQRLGEGFSGVLEDHFTIIRSCVQSHRGFEVKTIGDGYFAVFASVGDAVEAAVAIQLELNSHPWPDGGVVRVRIGIHTGVAEESADDYFGLEVHRAARIADAGHGGQVIVSSASRALSPSAFEYRPLGEHLLKGLDQPEMLFQLIVPGQPSEFPPLRTASAHPNNLPTLTTPLIGRASELETLARLLSQHRLVTILGPGGVGKTRLALALASESLPLYPGGVFFADLSGVSDPVFVMAAIANALRAAEGTFEAVVERIGQTEMLLVLDNFEQVAESADQVELLLRSAGGLRVVVTSQIPLRLPGEQRLVLSPLGLNGRAEESPGVELFLERARAVNPGFEADPSELERLVELLDGLPLALELAAARANLLDIEEMIERFQSGTRLSGAGSGPARHRSLEDALLWSYGLLGPGEQAAFRRLGVFVGGMTVAAAEAVAMGEPVSDPLGAVAELVDRSLLLPVPTSSGRWRMLDGVRRFAQERLDESGESEQVGTNYVGFFCDLARQAATGLQSDRGEWWQARLEAEQANFREVLTRLFDDGDVDRGLALLGDTWRYYQSRGQLGELELWLDRFFGLDETEDAGEGVIKGLMARAALRYWQSSPAEAVSDYRSALAAVRELGDDELLAEALYGLATSLIINRQEEEGMGLLDEVKELYTKLGDAGGLADVLTAEVFGTLTRHGPAGLGDELGEAVTLYEAAGRKIQVTQGTFGLAGVALAEGRFADARKIARHGLERALRLSDFYLLVWGLEFAALAELELGNLELAARLAGAAEVGSGTIGGGWSPQVLGLRDARTRLADLLGEEGAEAAMAPGRELSLPEAVALAMGKDGQDVRLGFGRPES